MLRPMIAAPMFLVPSSMTAELAFVTPPSWPCALRQASSSNTHSCNCMPPIPIGFSTL